ncbi:cryptochrome/photolyase family protein [Litoribacterium kuwaitense]|uniref:cryptochrome/photolyase family protein n=1 Tax=Litoribacterium kuwaitense TaxID=1398745 RepID=UPI001FE99F88|nr:deoxyribodipyrimidine photo-lyase [Litoribacterium kuwaitense]
MTTVDSSSVVAVWFRNDLRLHDHTALFYAMQYAKQHECRLFAFFHIHPDMIRPFTKRHDYFFRTLEAVRKEATKHQFPIHIFSGSLKDALQTASEEVSNWQAVFFNKDETPFGKARDGEAIAWYHENNILPFSFEDGHLVGPYDVEKKGGGHYRVFTPYLRAWREQVKPAVLDIDATELTTLAWRQNAISHDGEEKLAALLTQCKMPWKTIGEHAAKQRMLSFMRTKAGRYDERRDYPAIDGTSRLSPYLKTGALSIRTLYEAAAVQIENGNQSSQVDTFVQELAWRDFYYMIHVHYPNCQNEEINQNYRTMTWNNNEAWLECWKIGQTGFPIVDAAMRQLNQIGWMHNRLRMVVASFLTKDLLIDWRVGERYFASALIDYDPSSNIGGWQWAASTGTDAVPYFRVFNPTRQSERFDPEGAFIRKYVPELAGVPTKYIHQPEKMSHEEQQKAGCIIGQDYPEPMVDHKERRQIALRQFEQAKQEQTD